MPKVNQNVAIQHKNHISNSALSYKHPKLADYARKVGDQCNDKL